VSNEPDKYYELLGVRPGASANELKEAYRDMAKVWHPDRFSHDPRLQQKAQEKLKEINEAYDRLTSGNAGTRTRPTPAEAEPSAPPPAALRPNHARLVLPAALAFCAIFSAALIALVPRGARRASEQTPTAEQEARPVEDARLPDGATAPPAAQPSRGREATGRRTSAGASSGVAPVPESGAQQPRPMQTTTVTVDTATGLLATRDCPVVSRMTYASGSEPRQYCNAHQKTKSAAQAGPTGRQDSHLKSMGKRLAAPVRWLGGGNGAEAGQTRDAQPVGGDNPQEL